MELDNNDEIKVKPNVPIVKVRLLGELEPDYVFRILLTWVRERPDIVKKVLELEGKVNCCFPNECSLFPCPVLKCDCEEIVDGHPRGGTWY